MTPLVITDESSHSVKLLPSRHLPPYYSVLSNRVNSRERFAVIILMNLNKRYSAARVSVTHAANEGQPQTLRALSR